MENKMTYSVALSTVIATLDNGEVKDKLIALKDSIDKKNGHKSDKPTKTQTENAKIKVDILDSMEIGKAYTISDMMKEFECLADLSNQKVSSLVRQLCDTEQIKREEIKRKAYFSVVVAE